MKIRLPRKAKKLLKKRISNWQNVNKYDLTKEEFPYWIKWNAYF